MLAALVRRKLPVQRTSRPQRVIMMQNTSKSAVNSWSGSSVLGRKACSRAPMKAHWLRRALYLQARFCRAGGSCRPKRYRPRRHGVLQYHLRFNRATAEMRAQESRPWQSIRSTPTSFIQGASADLPRQPTPVPPGVICLTRGILRVLALLPSIPTLTASYMWAPAAMATALTGSACTARLMEGQRGLVPWAAMSLKAPISERSPSIRALPARKLGRLCMLPMAFQTIPDCGGP